MTTIFIAASGSGGHLFPAVYVGKALREKEPSVNIIGIGSGRPLESKIFSDWNVPYEMVQTVGIKNRGVTGIFQFLTSIPKAFWQTWKLFNKYKPDAVIGMGGYATVFPILFSWCMGIPTWIHEAELRPGLANYFLSFFSTKVSVAFEEAVLPTSSNKVFTGHPVRQGLQDACKRNVLTRAPKNILVLGGSQGAQGLDNAIPKLGSLLAQHDIHVRHQCRKGQVPTVAEAYRQQSVNAEVVEFIDDMTAAYKWADIVISRSGAGSIMELGVVNIPTIFVPLPNSQGDHQTANAQTLVKAGKAYLVPEREANFIERLSEAVETVLDNEVYNQMLQRPSNLRNIHAAESIANGVFCLIPRQ